jgi:hypothetical protein
LGWKERKRSSINSPVRERVRDEEGREQRGKERQKNEW